MAEVISPNMNWGGLHGQKCALPDKDSSSLRAELTRMEFSAQTKKSDRARLEEVEAMRLKVGSKVRMNRNGAEREVQDISRKNGKIKLVGATIRCCPHDLELIE